MENYVRGPVARKQGAKQKLSPSMCVCTRMCGDEKWEPIIMQKPFSLEKGWFHSKLPSVGTEVPPLIYCHAAIGSDCPPCDCGLLSSSLARPSIYVMW